MRRIIASGVCAIGMYPAAWAGPAVCVGSLTDIELLHRVKQDAYFTHQTLPSKRLRLEYDGCGYRIYVGGRAPNAPDGEVLLVDRHGHVTQVVRPR